MKIRTRLEISAVFFVCVVLAIGLTLFFTSQQVNEALGQHDAADEVVESAFVLNILTGDYLLHQEERALSQWHLKYGSLSEHLTELEFQDPDKQTILDEMRQIHEDINVTFSQLVASYEEQETSGEESGLREILTAQLSVKLQDMVSDASLLSEAFQERLVIATQTGRLLVMVFAITIVAVIGANSTVIINSIAKPIAKLQEGVEMITDGNLDYKVGTSAKDEIGQLSREFDQMTLSLSKEITRRKRIEDELRSHSEHLEELVDERTRELEESQEQLVKAERLAAIGQAATMVGHDLRNPLQAIKNAAYYVNDRLQYLPSSTPITPKTMKMLQIINESVDYADKIVRELKDFVSTKTPQLRKTDVSTIVKDALSQVEAPENVELITELGHLPEIEADKEMIKRVFTNIAANGIQAMENGGTLKVSTKKTRRFVKISFEDTGIGISKENVKKLFAPFITTKAQGMGVGLAICKNFVDAHGGSILVESEEGKGSTFTVKLPIQKEHARQNS